MWGDETSWLDSLWGEERHLQSMTYILCFRLDNYHSIDACNSALDIDSPSLDPSELQPQLALYNRDPAFFKELGGAEVKELSIDTVLSKVADQTAICHEYKMNGYLTYWPGPCYHIGHRLQFSVLSVADSISQLSNQGLWAPASSGYLQCLWKDFWSVWKGTWDANVLPGFQGSKWHVSSCDHVRETEKSSVKQNERRILNIIHHVSAYFCLPGIQWLHNKNF